MAECRRGRVIERRKIDALSVCGADPVCLGDISHLCSSCMGKDFSKFWQKYSCTEGLSLSRLASASENICNQVLDLNVGLGLPNVEMISSGEEFDYMYMRI